MAYTTVIFEQPRTGSVKKAPVGFSWTVLLFGFFPPLFRGDWKWALIMFAIGLITFGLSNLVFMFIYNKLYIADLIGAGYKVRDVEHGTIESVETKSGIALPRLLSETA